MTKFFAIFFSLQLIISPLALGETTPPPVAGNEGSIEVLREKGAESRAKVGGYAFYANQILSLGTGIVGSSILTSCPLGSMQPSMYIYLAGSLGYIGMEIWGATNQSNIQNRAAEDLQLLEESRLQGGDYQLETLKAALKDEQNSKDFLEMRKYLMLTLAVVYAVAAIVSAYEFQRSLPIIPTGGLFITDNANCNSGSGTALQKVLGLVVTTAFSAGTSIGSTPGEGPVGIGITLFKVVLPIALNALNLSVMAYSSAIGRIITFGISAALVGVVAGGLQVNEDVASGNIKKLRKVVTHVERNPRPNPSFNLPDPKKPKNPEARDEEGYGANKNKESIGSVTPTKNEKIRSPLKKRCLSEKDGHIISSENCSHPLKIQPPPMMVGINDSDLGDAINASTNWAQAVANGDRAAANTASGKLLAMASRVQKMKEEAFRQVNGKLKMLGKPPIDFEKESSNKLAELQEQLSSEVRKQGFNTASLSTTKPENVNSTANDQGEVHPARSATVPAVANSELPNLDTDLEEEPKTEVAALAPAGAGFSNFEPTEEDISKKPETSIFKQLSLRYYLNYPKILKKKDVGSVPNKP